jgi:hypothetical protein
LPVLRKQDWVANHGVCRSLLGPTRNTNAPRDDEENWSVAQPKNFYVRGKSAVCYPHGLLETEWIYDSVDASTHGGKYLQYWRELSDQTEVIREVDAASALEGSGLGCSLARSFNLLLWAHQNLEWQIVRSKSSRADEGLVPPQADHP